jgi:hypothetical protein
MTKYPYCFLFAILIFTGCSKRNEEPRQIQLPTGNPPATPATGPVYHHSATYTFTGNRVAGDTLWFSTDAKNGKKFSWDFGDGTTSALPEPAHVYATHGTYTLKVVVDDTILHPGKFAIPHYAYTGQIIILPDPLYTHKIVTPKKWQFITEITKNGVLDSVFKKEGWVTIEYIDKVTVKSANPEILNTGYMVYSPQKSKGNVLAFVIPNGGSLYFDHVADTMTYYHSSGGSAQGGGPLIIWTTTGKTL